MKKYLLSLFLVSLYFIATAGESTCLPATVPMEVVVSGSKLPHADLEYSAQGGLTFFHISHSAKRVAGDSPFIEYGWTNISSPYTSLYVTASTLHSKRYLLHIHPSHHFW